MIYLTANAKIIHKIRLEGGEAQFRVDGGLRVDEWIYDELLLLLSIVAAVVDVGQESFFLS